MQMLFYTLVSDYLLQSGINCPACIVNGTLPVKLERHAS